MPRCRTSEIREESDGEDEGSDGEEDEGEKYSFPELDSKIRECISEYGGAVFPKLNFSSPKVYLELRQICTETS